MVFDISDFTLNEVITIWKENIETDFFKLRVDNKDYVISVNHVGVTYFSLTLFNRTNQINDNNPIEYEMNEYEKQLEEPFYKEALERGIGIFPRLPSLTNILESHEFELSELNEITVDFIERLYFNDELTSLISQSIGYKNLKNPTNDFEEKFGEFIYGICCEKINNNEKLQKELIELHEKNEKEKKELEERLELIRKNEKETQRKMQEFEKEIGSYERKNSSSYNIRW